MITNPVAATPHRAVPDTITPLDAAHNATELSTGTAPTNTTTATKRPATGLLGSRRPAYTPSLDAGEEAEPDLEPKFNAKSLLADQDALIDADDRLGEAGAVECGDGFVLEADEDWFGEIQESQRVAQESLVKAHIQTAEGKGYRSPEEVATAKKAAAIRAAKRTKWFLLSIILTGLTAVVLLGSVALAGGAA